MSHDLIDIQCCYEVTLVIFFGVFAIPPNDIIYTRGLARSPRDTTVSTMLHCISIPIQRMNFLCLSYFSFYVIPVFSGAHFTNVLCNGEGYKSILHAVQGKYSDLSGGIVSVVPVCVYLHCL